MGGQVLAVESKAVTLPRDEVRRFGRAVPWADSPIVGAELTEPQLDVLARYVDERLISRSIGDGLALFCYTPKCANERYWTPLTRACRGLVLTFAGQVVARPFDKFFNVGEMQETQPGALEIVAKSAGEPLVLEKRDGSLGIVFWDEARARWDVCTKGSFASDQACYARQFLLPKIHLGALERGVTYLAEIIYPENRIVVDYQGGEGLTLLGARRTTGEELTFAAVADAAGQAGFQLPAWFRLRDVAPRGLRGHKVFAPNSEGYVLRYPTNPPLRAKLKSPWYVRVHALISRMRPLAVLEMICDGTDEAAIEQLPPGLSEEFRGIRDDLNRRVDALLLDASTLATDALCATTCEGFSALLRPGLRGEFARAMMRMAPSRRDLQAIAWAKVDRKDEKAAARKALRKELEA